MNAIFIFGQSALCTLLLLLLSLLLGCCCYLLYHVHYDGYGMGIILGIYMFKWSIRHACYNFWPDDTSTDPLSCSTLYMDTWGMLLVGKIISRTKLNCQMYHIFCAVVDELADS